MTLWPDKVLAFGRAVSGLSSRVHSPGVGIAHVGRSLHRPAIRASCFRKPIPTSASITRATGSRKTKAARRGAASADACERRSAGGFSSVRLLVVDSAKSPRCIAAAAHSVERIGIRLAVGRRFVLWFHVAVSLEPPDTGPRPPMSVATIASSSIAVGAAAS